MSNLYSHEARPLLQKRWVFCQRVERRHISSSFEVTYLQTYNPNTNRLEKITRAVIKSGNTSPLTYNNYSYSPITGVFTKGALITQTHCTRLHINFDLIGKGQYFIYWDDSILPLRIWTKMNFPSDQFHQNSPTLNKVSYNKVMLY